MPSKEKGAGEMDTFMDKFAQRKKAQGMIDANAAADAAKIEKLKSQVSEYELLLQEMRKVNLKTAENAGQMRKAIQTGIDKLEEFQAENAVQAEKDQMMTEIKSQLEAILPAIQDQQEMISEEVKKQQEAFFRETQKQQEALSEEVKKQQETLSEEVKEQQKALLEETKKQQEAFSEEMKKQLEEAFRQSEDFFHKESVKVYRNVQAAMTEETNKQTESLSVLQTASGKKQKAVLPLTVFILLALLADLAVHFLYLLNIKLF